MASPDFDPKTERIFEGKEVFFSGSYKIPHPNPDLFPNLISFMEENGARVGSRHMAEARNPYEFDRKFNQLTGVNIWWMEKREAAIKVRRANLTQLDESKYLVVILGQQKSDGTTTLIQRALDNYEMRGRLIPVLCLIQTDIPDEDVSNMIKGIGIEDSPAAFIERYSDIDDAKMKIKEFLISY